jgi:hypothetical protein
MKIAHLILVHKNPAQLEKLLNHMQHPAFDFYLHIDRKVDIAAFLPLAARPDVYFIENRVSIYWAGFGTIQATINGFQEILPKGYDYINVISGQDFPIKSADYIYNYVLDRQGTEFITCESIEDEWKDASPRIKRYDLINYNIPGKHRLSNLLTAILPKRKFPFPDHKIVGRANWFMLTSKAAAYTIQFLKENPQLISFYKYVWGADELIFSTILFNSVFRDNISNNLTYVDWTDKHDGHPKVLGAEDVEILKNSDKLFARKLDMDVDAQIFRLLEQI